MIIYRLLSATRFNSNICIRPGRLILPVSLSIARLGLQQQGRSDILNRSYTTKKNDSLSTQPGKPTKSNVKLDKERERLEKFIERSSILSKLNKNPKFNSYFIKLREVGAIPTITSFFILHELTAAIPLIFVWYILYHLNLWDEFNITESSNPILVKCSHAIERMVGDKYETLDKHKLVITGAISYSLVKVLGPLRMFVSLWAAPYFGKYLILPFYKFKPILKRFLKRT
ncbi:MIOREX complex component 11 [Monosporozyma servazzii]